MKADGVRVLRFTEYRYATAEQAAEDMGRWTLHREQRDFSMRSAVMPFEAIAWERDAALEALLQQTDEAEELVDQYAAAPSPSAKARTMYEALRDLCVAVRRREAPWR